MLRISDMLEGAEATSQHDAEMFIRESYSAGRSSATVKQQQEDWILGTFVKLYSRWARPSLGGPELIWASRNPAGTNHADFSVYDRSKSYLLDIKLPPCSRNH
jgi:hypothetical protein